MNDKINYALIETLIPVVLGIKKYHQHQVYGLKNIPDVGPALIVCNHSYATYDIVLLQHAIYERYGRLFRSLADRWFFKSKWVADFMHQTGSIEGAPDAARDLLNQGELLGVAPGGMLEAIQPHERRREVCWEQRKGFVKLAIETQVPVILVACPAADEIYTIYRSEVSEYFYERFKLPFAVMHGIGPTLLPKPVKLIHYIHPPLHPPKSLAQLDSFHSELTEKMTQLMKNPRKKLKS